MSTEEAPVDGSSAPTEKVVKFCSLSKPFAPGSMDRAFGGHVYAQAAYAASKTVGVGFCLHVCIIFLSLSLTCYFSFLFGLSLFSACGMGMDWVRTGGWKKGYHITL